MSYSAVVYFLVAQTDYSFGLGGTSSEILPSGASVMPVAEPYSFDTREFYFFKTKLGDSRNLPRHTAART